MDKVNSTLAALNILVVAVLLVLFVLPRLREHRELRSEGPRSVGPNRPGQELADAVTEWAKTTGVLTPEGAVDPDQAVDGDVDSGEERS